MENTASAAVGCDIRWRAVVFLTSASNVTCNPMVTFLTSAQKNNRASPNVETHVDYVGQCCGGSGQKLKGFSYW